MFSFISSAHAQDVAQAATQPNAFMSLMPLILIVAVMYFFMIRPQQKRIKAHQAMIGAVKRNDTIVTGGGVIGKVTNVNEEKAIVTVEISEGVEIKINRSTISEVLEKDAAKEVLKAVPAADKKKEAPKKKNTNKKSK